MQTGRVGVVAVRWTWAGLVASLGGALGGLALVGPARPAPVAPVAATAVRPAAAAPAPAPLPATSPAPVAVVQRGTGRTAVVGGTGPRQGTGPLRRYTVAVEGGLGVDAVGFAGEVQATLADPRSYGAGGRASFQRVDGGPVAFRVVLASPDTTDRLCRPLDTGGTLSCGNGDRAVLNLRRWLTGATAYAGDLPRYRQYLVLHEVGHTLGHSHERCPGPGRLAPVMLQQTKGVGSCRPNPWPYP